MKPNASIHLSGYQERDFNIVHYDMFELPNTDLKFRGPKLERYVKGEYFTCIGAAQTFGCFCEEPFPKLLSEKVGIPVLNLGYGGAGPEFFNRQDSLLPYINKSRFVVLQAMSGRSQSNSVFECDGLEYLRRRSDGRSIGANAGYAELLRGSPRLAALPPRRLFGILARLLTRPKIKTLIAETRANWLENQIQLLSKISVPVVFVWFSKRAPDYKENYRNLHSLFGQFPQLVNRAMVERVRAQCDHYVEVVTDRGSPQLLVDRFSKQPTTVNPNRDRPDLDVGVAWTHNTYYPTPEMHIDAAEALLAVCRAFGIQGG